MCSLTYCLREFWGACLAEQSYLTGNYWTHSKRIMTLRSQESAQTRVTRLLWRSLFKCLVKISSHWSDVDVQACFPMGAEYSSWADTPDFLSPRSPLLCACFFLFFFIMSGCVCGSVHARCCASSAYWKSLIIRCHSDELGRCSPFHPLIVCYLLSGPISSHGICGIRCHFLYTIRCFEGSFLLSLIHPNLCCNVMIVCYCFPKSLS